MDIVAYLQRICYDGSLEPTAATLRSLHLAHMRAVPFENLDISLGRQIVLDETALFDKIVMRRRGGFCYELNGLFAELLRQLGFEVTLLSASVLKENGQFGPPYDHLILWVTLPDGLSASPTDWLADVGFGNSFQYPLLLDRTAAQRQPSGSYRLVTYDAEYSLMQHLVEAHWQDKFIFSRSPCQLSDFIPMCRYQETSPDSMFTQKRLCSIATPNGRITLSNRKLLITTDRKRQERELTDDAEYQAVLAKYFQIVL